MATYKRKRRRKVNSHKACAKRATDALTKLAEAAEAGLTHQEFLQYHGMSKYDWHKIQIWLNRHKIKYPKLKGQRRTKAEMLAELKQSIAKGIEKIGTGEPDVYVPIDCEPRGNGHIGFTIEVGVDR